LKYLDGSPGFQIDCERSKIAMPRVKHGFSFPEPFGDVKTPNISNQFNSNSFESEGVLNCGKHGPPSPICFGRGIDAIS
jgi:hypothetical protein